MINDIIWPISLSSWPEELSHHVYANHKGQDHLPTLRSSGASRLVAGLWPILVAANWWALRAYSMQASCMSSENPPPDWGFWNLNLEALQFFSISWGSVVAGFCVRRWCTLHSYLNGKYSHLLHHLNKGTQWRYLSFIKLSQW